MRSQIITIILVLIPFSGAFSQLSNSDYLYKANNGFSEDFSASEFSRPNEQAFYQSQSSDNLCLGGNPAFSIYAKTYKQLTYYDLLHGPMESSEIPGLPKQENGPWQEVGTLVGVFVISFALTVGIMALGEGDVQWETATITGLIFVALGAFVL